jgi:peptide/nickel transport system substrate-binding protein
MTFSRRQFIILASGAGGALALGACSSDDDAAAPGTGDAAPGPTVGTAPETTTAGSVADTPAPTTGGAVRVAALASPSDTLNPTTITGIMDYIVAFHVHDSLVILQGGDFVYQLAESIEPSDDATEWTITVREGPTFHDGTPVTANDVRYSLQLLATSPNYAQFFASIDLANSTVPDDRTLVLPMLVPRGDLVESVFSQLSFVVPDGFENWGANIGSGPYTLASYEAGVGARLERNPDYWGPAPSIDVIELTAIADPSTRLSALKSGDIDWANGITAIGAAGEEGNDDIVIIRGDSENSTMRTFAMNVTQAPFDNPDVVEAVKLAVDRQALIDIVLLGNGVVGNDMPSLGLPGYNDSIPQRARDLDRARELFAGAGVDSFTLRAAEFVPGAVASAEVFAQQLAEAGITVTVDEADPTTYFDDFATVLSTPIQAFYFINRPAVTHVASYTGTSSPFNVTGFATPEYDAALADALAQPDADAREAAVRDLLQTLHDEDGMVIWAFDPQIDAARPGIDGVQLVQSVPVFWTATVQ